MTNEKSTPAHKRDLRADDGAIRQWPGADERTKPAVQRFYDTINRQLDESAYGPWAVSLNYGFEPDGSPERAVVPSPARSLNRSSVKLVLELVGATLMSGKSVLDVGCGRGGTLSTISRFFAPASVVGLDLSGEAIRFCRRTHILAGGKFVQGDAEHLPFRNASFDVVTNVESSHCYPDIEAFFAEVVRVLCPLGRFLYTDVVRAAEWQSRLEMLDSLGLRAEDERDITFNVVKACEAHASVRAAAFGERNAADVTGTFVGCAGTPIVDSLIDHELRYCMWTLSNHR